MEDKKISSEEVREAAESETDVIMEPGEKSEKAGRKSERRAPRPMGNLIIGIIMISVGTLWMLDSFNILNFSIMNLVFSLMDLWPLALVATGVAMIFKNKRGVRAAAWIIFAIAVISYAVLGPYIRTDRWSSMSYFNPFDFSNGNGSSNDSGDNSYSVDSASYEYKAEKTGDAVISIGGGTVRLGSDPENLFSYVLPGTQFSKKSVTSDDGRAKAVFEEKGFSGSKVGGRSYSFYLSDKVVWDITLNSGGIDGQFDLENVRAANLKVNSGAGSMDFKLGSKHEIQNVTVNMAANDLIFRVPKGAGVKFTTNVPLSDNNFAEKGLLKDGKVYTSEGYEKSTAKVNIVINSAVGDITLYTY
jgi:hypothetical protein